MKCLDPEHKNIHDCYDKFHRLIWDRSDYSMVNMNNSELESIHKNCDLVYFKLILVRLRRRYNKEEWIFFKNFVENNLDEMMKVFSLRWLLSIVDTYADHGNDVESSNAMIVDGVITQEKLRKTEKCLYDFIRRDREKEYTHLPIGNGTAYSIILNRGDDTVISYFKRTFKCLEKTPVLLKIYIYYMESAWNHDSVFSVLDKHYQYIKTGYDDYMKDRK